MQISNCKFQVASFKLQGAFCLLQLCLLLVPISVVQAQDTPVEPPVPVPVFERDTTPMAYILAAEPERSYPITDTLADWRFRVYDPARKQTIDWGTLGNFGSSARPLYHVTRPRSGFDPGFHAFDLYRQEADQLRYARHTNSYNEVYFSQGPSQKEVESGAVFSRTFSKGANLSFDYGAINNLGQYRYQRDKHNRLSVGLWLPFGKRYEMFAVYNRQVFRQQENGGITTDTIFGQDDFSGAISAPINLSDEEALTRDDKQVIHLQQHLKFNRGDVGKQVYRASLATSWTNQKFKFSNADMRADTAFFDTFLVDKRGLRNFWALRQLDNRFELTTFKSKTAGRPATSLSLGARHALILLHQEPSDTTFSNFFFTGRLSITPSDNFNLVARGELGLLNNFGEYLVDAAARVGLGKAGLLRLNLLSQRSPPSMLHHKLYISKQLFWQNDFEKPVETTLSAGYVLPKLGIEMSGQTHLINNFLYYDQLGLASQTTSPVAVSQLQAMLFLKFGRVWHLDNTVALQRTNRDDVLRLPSWFSKNSLYFSGKVFKQRLDLSAGFDFRINSEFRPDAWQPVTNQFHLQDTFTQKIYPWVDAFIAFKIQSFRFYFRFENLYNLLEPTQIYYQTASHPQPFSSFRLGVSWRFIDDSRGGGSTAPATPPSGIRPGQFR